MNEHYYCIIMAGGIGSRFWPISRESCPKQFLDLTGKGKSFLRLTYDRFSRTIPKENIIVASLTRYKDLVLEQIPELDEKNLLLEPYNRNTAPCLAFSAYSLLKRDPDAVFVAAPADHLIGDEDLFDETVRNAIEYAATQRALITVGVVPTRADANFGYIQAQGGQGAYYNNKPLKVKTFTEKPDAQLAEVFIQSGEFLWNSGIFFWKAQVIREELEKYAPEITRLFTGWEYNLGTETEDSFLQKVYMSIERKSIDYAVMEKTDIAWVYPARFSWADIGNWESLYGYLAEKDVNGNAIKAHKQLVLDDKDCIIFSDCPKKLVSLKGLDNFVIVDTEDVLMICPRDDIKLKDVVAHIGLPDYEKYR